MNIKEMKNIMSLLFKATNEKNSEFIQDFLADQITWHDGCAGENGTDSFFVASKDDFIEHNVLGIGNIKQKTIEFQIAEDDKVFTYFTVEGVHVRDFMNCTPTGKKIRYNAMYVTRFENNLITEVWACMYGHYILQQIGAI